MSYYDFLEVPKTATKEEINKAYKKQALKWHPDRNPNNKEKAEEMFKKIGEAHEVLTNEEKRSIYDRFGEEGLKNGAGTNPFENAGFNPFDLFNNMFGGGMQMPRQQNDENRPVVVNMKCTLKDTYIGAKKSETLERSIFCNGCDATGYKDKKNHTCSTCNGKGIQLIIHQIGPGMVQQSTRTCTACKGTGGDMNHPRCEKCHGSKRLKELVKLDMDIKKGIRKGNQMMIRGNGNQIGMNQYTDIVVVFDVENDPIYSRKGNDLYRKVDISLRKALLGFEMVLDHIDGKQIVIKSNEIIQPFSTKMISRLGFTDVQNGSVGDYYLQFNVVFPERLGSKQLKALDIVFNKDEKDDSNHNISIDYQYKLENTPGNNGQRFYNSLDEESEDDGEGNGGPQKVQCAQQ